MQPFKIKSCGNFAPRFRAVVFALGNLRFGKEYHLYPQVA